LKAMPLYFFFHFVKEIASGNIFAWHPGADWQFPDLLDMWDEIAFIGIASKNFVNEGISIKRLPIKTNHRLSIPRNDLSPLKRQ
jgi:hypothetical protein